VDPGQAELLARLTARASAAIFAAALVCFAIDGRRHGRPRRRSLRALGAFIAAHTIHFSAVAWLAVVSQGENIRARGGAGPVLAVAALFYVAVALVFFTWRAASHGQEIGRAHRASSHVSVLLVGAVFVNSYIARLGVEPVFALPVAALTGAIVMYFRWGGLTAPCTGHTRAKAAKLG
jgi:hypothetical protein